jgi:hypothetical protein
MNAVGEPPVVVQRPLVGGDEPADLAEDAAERAEHRLDPVHQPADDRLSGVEQQPAEVAEGRQDVRAEVSKEPDYGV